MLTKATQFLEFFAKIAKDELYAKRGVHEQCVKHIEYLAANKGQTIIKISKKKRKISRRALEGMILSNYYRNYLFFKEIPLKMLTFTLSLFPHYFN